MVRRRHLKEEYSFIWLVIGVIFFILATFPRIAVFISDTIGTELTINTLFFMAIVLILMLCLYFSLKISKLVNQTKALAQKIALLEFELRKKGKP
jgi:hypothetical protein